MHIDFNSIPGQKLNGEFWQREQGSQSALVSIITPYYNASKYFEQTFNSVLNQTFQLFEWIIVDDGSDEENRAILDKFAIKDSRIKIIHQENGGLSCARNTAVTNSTTDMFFPLDADDLISETCLEYLYWALITNEEASWAYCDVAGFQDIEYIWKKKFSAKQMKSENLLVASALIRKKDFEEVGGYKVEKYSYNEDWRFWLELLSAHKIPVHVNEVLFWYRRHDSMLKDVISDQKKVDFNREIIEKAKKDVDESVQAIEYPFEEKPNLFKNLIYREWNVLEENKADKKLLWIIPWMNVGGADKFNLDAIVGLKDNGYRHYIVTTQCSDNLWEDRFVDFVEEIHHLTNFMSKYNYPEFVSYIIQTRGIDMVVVSNSEEGYWMLPWIRQHHATLPIIDYVHMEEWYWHGGGHARSSAVMAGVSDRTLVCNSYTRNVMIQKMYADGKNTFCMHIGVDTDYFNPNEEKSGYLHELLDLPERKKIVLFPCRICEQKRPFLMLEIAKKVIKADKDIVFVVVGDGPELKKLRQKINKANISDKVFCIGTSSEMRACYKDSDVLLICSLQEGLTLTTYEAMSMGVPVISSDAGGQCDLVTEDVGRIVPLEGDASSVLKSDNYSEQEIETYARCILELMENDELRKQLGEKAKSKVTKSFSIKNMHEEFDSHIKEVLVSESLKCKRKGIANGLCAMPNMANEFYGTHIRWNLEENEIKFISPARYVINKAVGLPVVGKGIYHVGRFVKYKILKRI